MMILVATLQLAVTIVVVIEKVYEMPQFFKCGESFISGFAPQDRQTEAAVFYERS